MKILIISDLHIDYNETSLDKEISFGFESKLGEVDIVLIAGDIGGDYIVESKYLSKLEAIINEKNYKTVVLTVGGNHLGYNYLNGAYTRTKENANQMLRQVYQGDSIYFLENDIAIKGDYVFFGCCLYTDFSLYNNPEKSKSIAEYYINDFKNVKTFDYDLGVVRNVTSDDYIKWHKRSVEMIKEACNKFKDKKIVLLTHFLVTPKSINKKYVDNILNPFYCTNLENLILENQNIKLIACGHSHANSECNIGNTKIILEPYGYYGYEQKLKPEDYFGRIIEI